MVFDFQIPSFIFCLGLFIDFRYESNTLFIPLLGRALMSKNNLFLKDVKAEEIVNKISFDFKSLKQSKWLSMYMSLRGLIIDELCDKYITNNLNCTVIHLGQRLGEWSSTYGSEATKRKVYVGKSLKYFSKIGVGEFLVETKYGINIGDELLITGPTTGVIEVKVDEMHVDNHPASRCERGELFSIKVTGKDVILNASGTLGFNSTNPIKYSTKIEKVSEKYDGMAFKDSENNTKHLLVATNHMEDTKKQIVVIGDSFSSTAQSIGPLWYTYVAKKYNADVITHASDGMGFIVGGDNDFNHQINKCAAEADIDNVMTVYIYGGLNDLTQFTSDSSGVATTFRNAVINVISNAQTKFPNSEIVLVGIDTFQQYNYYGTGAYGKNNAMFTMRIWMNYAALKTKVKFIDITNQTLYTPEFYGDANSGGQKHPSAIGEAYIANLILGGSPYKFDTREQPTMTGTNCTITSIATNTKIDSIWVHGLMRPSMTGTCIISFKGYTPPASEYVLFVSESSRKATYGIVDVDNEQITLYSFDDEEYYFEFQLS